MALSAKRIIFKGRVQGVGFRYTAHRIAGNYTLTGYVKNVFDGTVEVFAQGQSSEIEQFIVDIQDHFKGHITDVNSQTDVPNPSYTSFKITM